MNSIVTIGCLVVLAATAYADQAYVEKIFATMKECGIKQGLSDMELAAYMKMEQGDAKTFGCATACFLKEYGLLLAGGGLNVPESHAIIDKMLDDKPEEGQKMKDAVSVCAEKVKEMTEECTLASEFSNCYHSQMKPSRK